MAHDAFLRAILEAPDDDAPRLIYADWLDEHDDPARAEFIRIQCARAAQDVRDEPMSAGQRRALDMREMDLLARHLDDWTRPFRRLGDNCGFDRGFVARLRVPGERLTAEPESILRLAPIQHLTLIWGITPPATRGQMLGRLHSCPDLYRLRSLNLAGGYIGSTGLQALAACDYLTGLTALDLSGNHVGDAGLRALTSAPMLSSLESLDLRNNDIGPSGIRCLIAGLRALEQSGQPAVLRDIDLIGNRLGAAGRQEIHDYPFLRRIVRL
jgi:uncharacterized protein (TIGR02996 family)